MPHFTYAVDLKVGLLHPLDLRFKLPVTVVARRLQGRIGLTAACR